MDKSVIRISKELSDIQKTIDLFACRDVDVRHVKAMIVGPHETPYEFGFFEFAITFGKDYPSVSPKVICLTTNGGRCRFNPNIYSSGKVCLSILGTWRGERGEQWSSAQGMESILLSIQSLMSSNPYENEPGYEHARQAHDKRKQKLYVQKIRHETLRITIIQRLEQYLGLLPNGGKAKPAEPVDSEEMDEVTVPFEPFKDLCKRRFLWYFESYLAAIKQGQEDSPDGQAFERMPFETDGSNGMTGSFCYTDLERRLMTIKRHLDLETVGWASVGLQDPETTVVVNLKHQYQQVSNALKFHDLPHDVSLENGNPLVWIITYFGRPMTNMDGGIFRIKMSISPNFPEEQPRVRLESKIFHLQIASDGTICYAPPPMKGEDMKTHIETIIALLEEEEPAYDPRKIVNLEASRLYWSKKTDDKKQYSRRLRRSVRDSMEDFPE